MCCTRLAEHIGSKSYENNRHLRTIAQLCRAISSQRRYVSTIGKKLVKQQYLLHRSSPYGELWPTSGWDRLPSLGHPNKFQRVSRLGFVTAPTSLNGGQPNFARCWPSPFLGALVPNGILSRAKFTLRQSLVFSYIGSVTAQHSSSVCQPNSAAL